MLLMRYTLEHFTVNKQEHFHKTYSRIQSPPKVSQNNK